MNDLGYILLTVFVSVILLYCYNFGLHKSGVEPIKRKQKLLKASLVLAGWFVYLISMAKTGILQDYSLPPRFPIFTIFPAFGFIFVVARRKETAVFISNIPTTWLTFVQSFRIVVELLFVASVANGMLHPEVTIEGYNYDMIFGFSALLVGYLDYKYLNKSNTLVLWWNYLGLAVLFSVIILFVTTTYIPNLWGSETTLALPGMVSFPTILVPAFLMPVAVFIHVLSIIKLRNEKKVES
ncbi:MAG: hypothetical protein ACI8ZN_000929 [Bacteroidia bacterium]|jgi:hypothetical protein